MADETGAAQPADDSPEAVAARVEAAEAAIMRCVREQLDTLRLPAYLLVVGIDVELVRAHTIVGGVETHLGDVELRIAARLPGRVLS